MATEFDIDADLSEINSPIYDRAADGGKEGLEDLIWLTSIKINGIAIIPFIPEGKYCTFICLDFKNKLSSYFRFFDFSPQFNFFCFFIVISDFYF